MPAVSTHEFLSGEGYRLEFAYAAPLLTVWLQGEVEAKHEAILHVTRAYWLQIAAKLRDCGARQLLVLDALPNEVMTDAELLHFFAGIEGTGLDRAQVAYVEGRSDQVPRIEFVEQLALERGYRIRIFSNESDARLWLRFGGDGAL